MTVLHTYMSGGLLRACVVRRVAEDIDLCIFRGSSVSLRYGCNMCHVTEYKLRELCECC